MINIKTNLPENVQTQTMCVLSLNDLKEIMNECFMLARLDFTKDEQGEKLLNIAQVAKRLEISRQTLHRWNKSGYLVPIKVGKKVCYKLDDILRIEGYETV